MGKIRVDGLENMHKKLKQMEKNANALSKKKEVSFSELFTIAFMKEHSKFTTFDELLDASPFRVENSEDFAAIPDDEFDEYVASVTDFDNWGEMRETATHDYISSQLGL